MRRPPRAQFCRFSLLSFSGIVCVLSVSSSGSISTRRLCWMWLHLIWPRGRKWMRRSSRISHRLAWSNSMLLKTFDSSFVFHLPVRKRSQEFFFDLISKSSPSLLWTHICTHLHGASCTTHTCGPLFFHEIRKRFLNAVRFDVGFFFLFFFIIGFLVCSLIESSFTHSIHTLVYLFVYFAVCGGLSLICGLQVISRRNDDTYSQCLVRVSTPTPLWGKSCVCWIGSRSWVFHYCMRLIIDF